MGQGGDFVSYFMDMVAQKGLTAAVDTALP